MGLCRRLGSPLALGTGWPPLKIQLGDQFFFLGGGVLFNTKSDYDTMSFLNTLIFMDSLPYCFSLAPRSYNLKEESTHTALAQAHGDEGGGRPTRSLSPPSLRRELLLGFGFQKQTSEF